MVSGWAMKACLGSWPFSLGWGRDSTGRRERGQSGGMLSSWAAPVPGRTQGGRPACPRSAAVLPCFRQLSQTRVGGGWSRRTGLARVVGTALCPLFFQSPSLLQVVLLYPDAPDPYAVSGSLSSVPFSPSLPILHVQAGSSLFLHPSLHGVRDLPKSHLKAWFETF